jgi:GT2 family glycosyltransferase
VRREYPSVNVIALERNLGFAAGNNVGLRRACGDLLLLLNVDTKVPDGALREMMAVMEREPTIAMLGCQHCDADGGPQVCYHSSFAGPLHGRFPAAQAKPLDGALDVAWISGACMMARREVYDRIGGLDTDYPLYYEDVDWCFRAWEAGWRVGWAPGIHILHDVGGSSGGMSQAERRALQLTSESIFYRKHCSRAEVWWWWARGTALGVRRAVWEAVRLCLWPRRRVLRKLCGRLDELSVYARLGCGLCRRRGGYRSVVEAGGGPGLCPTDRPRDDRGCDAP